MGFCCVISVLLVQFIMFNIVDVLSTKSENPHLFKTPQFSWSQEKSEMDRTVASLKVQSFGKYITQ